MLYRFLSENLEKRINKLEEQKDPESFKPYSEWGEGELENMKEEICTDSGYFISPNNLFKNTFARASKERFTGEKYYILRKSLNETFKPERVSEWGYDFTEILKTIDFEKHKAGFTDQQKINKMVELFEKVAELDFESEEIKKGFEDIIKAQVREIDKEANGGEVNPFVHSKEIIDFLFKLSLNERNPSDIHTIYDPDCNWGYFLLKFREWLGEPQLKIFGHENNESMHALCLINLLVHGLTREEFEIKQIPNWHTNLNVLESSSSKGEKKEYDVIFGNFLPLSDSRKKHNVSKFINHCSQHLNPTNGVAVVLYFENAMTIHNLETKNILEDLAHYRCIDCVISFQDEAKLCAEKVTKSLCILILKSRNNNTNRNLLMINFPKNYPSKLEEVTSLFSSEKLQELYRAVIHRDPMVLQNYKHIFLETEQLKEKDYSLSIRQYIWLANSESKNNQWSESMSALRKELKVVKKQIKDLKPIIDNKLLDLFGETS
ncbi:N-6 DNA methylase [Mycoplasma wenyonii]|nr:N-6 DNA methylase [Mycoplasma wenyonii]